MTCLYNQHIICGLVEDDSRSLDVAETGSKDLQIPIRLESNVTDLGTYVLAFAITIGPDEKN
jgi:hypothetical protein